MEAERCWFSDGGLSSNLPIHFFDAPIPAWPTLAIDLIEESPAHPLTPEAEENVWLPATNNAGVLETWKQLDQESGGKSLLSFLSSLLDVMQNWRDQTLARLPGQRDRIAHVILGDGEGGMNLEMPPPLIQRLSDRGRAAGRKLRHRFAEPPGPRELSWDNHRWVRYRAAMAALQDLLTAFARVYDQPNPDDLTYDQLIQHPPSYKKLTQEQKKRLLEANGKLAELGRELELIAKSHGDFHPGAPKPPGELRVRPRI